MQSDNISDKYDRVADRYDRMEALVEKLLFRKARRKTIEHAHGTVLEIGVGTGKNLPYYSSKEIVTGIDLSRGMLDQAITRASAMKHLDVDLIHMNAEHLTFPDDSFDTIVSTFVFCTVGDPHVGLREALRVLKPGGTAIFLEHMRSRIPPLNLPLLMMNLFTRPLLGTSMLRKTEKNIRSAGFVVHRVEYLFLDIVRLITATK